jgi:hypothetical protein
VEAIRGACFTGADWRPGGCEQAERRSQKAPTSGDGGYGLSDARARAFTSAGGPRRVTDCAEEKRGGGGRPWSGRSGQVGLDQVT